MKKLAIVAALLLVAFTACKKEEEQQEQPAQEYITADFSVKTGGYWGVTGYYSSGDISGRPAYGFIEDHLSVVVFDASIKAEQYVWEWGDGEQTYNCATYPDYQKKYSYYNRRYNNHTYAEPGTYTVTLTVANGDGETDCKSKTVTIL